MPPNENQCILTLDDKITHYR